MLRSTTSSCSSLGRVLTLRCIHVHKKGKVSSKWMFVHHSDLTKIILITSYYYPCSTVPGSSSALVPPFMFIMTPKSDSCIIFSHFLYYEICEQFSTPENISCPVLSGVFSFLVYSFNWRFLWFVNLQRFWSTQPTTITAFNFSNSFWFFPPPASFRPSGATCQSN